MRLSVLLILLLSYIKTVNNQRRTPGCPPPIASFIDYSDNVMVRKLENQEVVTVKVRENNYFGETRCSLPQELQDPLHRVYTSFKVVQGPNVNRIKYCTVLLMDTDFPETELELTLLLITDLIPGLFYCEGPISAQARIKVHLCETEACEQAWAAGQAGRGTKVYGTDGGVVEVPRSRSQETRVATLGTEVKPDYNYLVLIGIFFVVTLIAFSLVLGLIYFWCPGICKSGCCTRTRESKEDLGNTKILTVRDSFGRIIPDARTVDVWKTKENQVKSYDVPNAVDNKGRKAKKGGYTELIEEPDGLAFSNFNSGEENKRVLRTLDGRNDPGGIILLRRPKSPRNSSRLTILEELDPTTLAPFNHTRRNSRVFRLVDTGLERSPRHDVRVLHLDDYNHRSNAPAEVVRVGRHEHNGQTLNFSRHYATNNSNPIVIEVDRDPRERVHKDSDRNHRSYREYQRDRRKDADHRVQEEDRRYRRNNDVQILTIHDDGRHHNSDRADRDRDRDGKHRDKYYHREDRDNKHEGREDKRGERDNTRREILNNPGEQESKSDDRRNKHKGSFERTSDNQNRISNTQREEEKSVHNHYHGKDTEGSSLTKPRNIEERVVEVHQSNLRKAMSSISTIIEGDPSDYDDDLEDLDNLNPPDIRVEKPKNQPMEDFREQVESVEKPAEPTEPWSKRIAKSLGNFEDRNRTPSPAMASAAVALQAARRRREERSQGRGETEEERIHQQRGEMEEANLNSIQIAAEG